MEFASERVSEWMLSMTWAEFYLSVRNHVGHAIGCTARKVVDEIVISRVDCCNN